MKRLKVYLFYPLMFGLLLFACQKDDGPGTQQQEEEEEEEEVEEPQESDFSGEIEWVKNFGGSAEDDINKLIETPDGGTVGVGYTASTDGDITDKTTTDADYWIFKINTEGQLVWSKTYGGSMDDRAVSVINTLDGGLAVLGYSRSNDGDVTENNGFYDFWFLKLDASGNKQWERCYGFFGHDQGHALLQTPSGNYLLTGFIDYDEMENGLKNTSPSGYLPRHGVGEYWAIEIDPQGEEVWSQYYGGTNNDRVFDIAPTTDGGYILVGNSESDDYDITSPKGSYDFWVVKISSSGTLQWQKNFGGSGIEIAYGIEKSQDGNYLIIGDTRSADQDVTNPIGNADIWLLKISPSGSLLWQKSYGGTLFDTSRTIIEQSDKSLVIIGSSRSSDNHVSANYGESDFWLVITDAAGQITFEKNYGGSQLDFGNTGLVTSTGNIILAGSSQSNDGDIHNNKGSKDVVVLKLKTH